MGEAKSTKRCIFKSFEFMFTICFLCFRNKIKEKRGKCCDVHRRRAYATHTAHLMLTKYKENRFSLVEAEHGKTKSEEKFCLRK